MQDKKLESHNYCLLFGGGSRLCPGKELGLVIISIFLHYCVTTYRLFTHFTYFQQISISLPNNPQQVICLYAYISIYVSLLFNGWPFGFRWEEIGAEKILNFPRVEAPHGLHIRVSKYK